VGRFVGDYLQSGQMQILEVQNTHLPQAVPVYQVSCEANQLSPAPKAIGDYIHEFFYPAVRRPSSYFFKDAEYLLLNL